MTAAEAIARLTRPLTAEEIEWKIISSKNGQTTIAPFIDARAVMARLDEAFGPFGWQVRYTPAQVGDEHGVIASIAIKNPETGEWVEKQDGSGATDMEPFKGGISGALKRAAVAWGIGRELYRYPRVVIEGEHPWGRCGATCPWPSGRAWGPSGPTTWPPSSSSPSTSSSSSRPRTRPGPSSTSSPSSSSSPGCLPSWGS